MIDHNPWPEALQLAEGPAPDDLRRRSIQLEADLTTPPGWARLSRQELTDLLLG
jgi:hypothetical protein